VCAYHDLVKRAEVFTFGVMCTLLNGAGNTAIGLLCFHDFNHPYEKIDPANCEGNPIRSIPSIVSEGFRRSLAFL